MLALCVLACSSLLPLFSFPFPAVSHTFVSKSQSLLLFPPSLCTLCSQMVLALFPLNHFHSNCPVACLHFSTPPFRTFDIRLQFCFLGDGEFEEEKETPFLLPKYFLSLCFSDFLVVTQSFFCNTNLL